MRKSIFLIVGLIIPILIGVYLFSDLKKEEGSKVVKIEKIYTIQLYKNIYNAVNTTDEKGEKEIYIITNPNNWTNTSIKVLNVIEEGKYFTIYYNKSIFFEGYPNILKVEFYGTP